MKIGNEVQRIYMLSQVERTSACELACKICLPMPLTESFATNINIPLSVFAFV